MTARRKPDMEFADHAALQDYLRELLGVLEALTQDPGLSRVRQASPRHPAIAIYDVIQCTLNAGRVPIDRERSFSRAIARLMLDRRSWAATVSMLNAFDELDDAARRHITERATQASKFDDIGAELFYWGWLRAHGYDAFIQEASSLPDIKVKGSNPFWVEVKRISAESSVNRVRSVLTKANKQLQTADPTGVGVLFLHLDRPEAVECVDDNIPTDIQERIHEISRALQSSLCRSLGQVVVAWDDFDALQSGRDGSSLYVARRRSVVLTHQKPRAAPHFDGSRLHVGLTGIWRVEYPAIADFLVENTLGEMGIRTD